MLLIPHIDEEGNLNLSVFSFSQQQLYAVVETLQNERISAPIISLENDEIGRGGISLKVQKIDVPKLQRALNVTFKKVGEETTVSFNPPKSHFDGKITRSYKCSRIDSPPHACETIDAGNDSEAILKCALLAGEKNWLGGVPVPGTC